MRCYGIACDRTGKEIGGNAHKARVKMLAKGWTDRE
jgi:hypothetical protein